MISIGETYQRELVLFYIAECYSKVGKYDEALKYYTSIINSSQLSVDELKVIYEQIEEVSKLANKQLTEK